MKKRVILIICLALISLSCVVFAACSASENELNELAKEGYIITVQYDANGGKFNNRSNATVFNVFNPDNYTDEDGDGYIEISLSDKDPVLSKKSGAPVKDGYSFAGWYRTCELLTNEQGEPLDDYGNILEAGSDGVLRIKDTTTTATQGYSYSDYFDIENETISYKLDSGKYSVVLYAAWVPYFTFNYYYEDSETSEWTLAGSTTFDYSKTVQFKNYVYTRTAPDTPISDIDYIWTPNWSNPSDSTGAMVYTRKYSDDSTYTFPQVSGKTFLAAYTDETCLNSIGTSLQHGGSIVYNTTTHKLEMNNLTESIYVKYQDGEQYRIATAEQFVSYADTKAVCNYTILSSELDFSGLSWPSALSSGNFAGKIVLDAGLTSCTFKNINAENTSDNGDYGGLFGSIAATAVIGNITFSNVVYDMKTGSNKTIVEGTGYVYFGIFAGYIESGATVTGVTLTNAKLRIGKLSNTAEYKINLSVGDGAKIAYSGIQVELYSSERNDEGKYLYYVTQIEVDEATGQVTPTIQFAPSKTDKRDEESYIAYPVAS